MPVGSKDRTLEICIVVSTQKKCNNEKSLCFMEQSDLSLSNIIFFLFYDLLIRNIVILVSRKVLFRYQFSILVPEYLIHLKAYFLKDADIFKIIFDVDMLILLKI